MSYNDISIARYDWESFNRLLDKEDLQYWSEVDLSFLREGCWIKFDIEVNSKEDEWKRSVDRLTRFLQALGLFKTSLTLLGVGGLLIKRIKH